MTADLLHAQGLERWRAGDLQGALDVIGRAVAAQPGVAVYRNSLGAVLASTGDPAAGARLFLFTNQSGVGRGYFTMHDVGLVNDRMIELLDLGGDPFTRVCVAPERPDQPSVYRKPSPRFIREMLLEHGIAADRAWMLGDSPSDWEAGLSAGIRAAAIVLGAESDEA